MSDVRLRDITPRDEHQVLAWRNAPDVRRWMYTDHEISAEEHARWWRALPLDPTRRAFIAMLNDAPVGFASLSAIDRANKTCDWAYYLGDPSVRGQGVGAMVEFRVIEYVFLDGFERLGCEVLIDNAPVWKLHESFGFARAAILKARAIKAGAPVDVLRLELARDVWLDRRAGAAARLSAKGFSLDLSCGSSSL